MKIGLLLRFSYQNVLAINKQTSQIFVWFSLVKHYLCRKHTRTNEILLRSATPASTRLVGPTKS